MFKHFLGKIFKKKISPDHLIDNTLYYPNVILDFVFDEGVFLISVQNIGNYPAVNVSIKFDQKITGANKQDITTLPLFRNIPFMAPHKTISTFLDMSDSYFNGSNPLKVSTDIRFSDMYGNAYQNYIHHNLGIYKDISYLKRTGPRIKNTAEPASEIAIKGGENYYGNIKRNALSEQ